MTNDYKELLLKYLTGNINEAVESTIPYYKNFSHTTRPIGEYAGGSIALKCKDGNGNYNGKTLLYTPAMNGTSYKIPVTLLDENANILHVYREFNTGTNFLCFMGLEIDETGRVYGVDYDPNTQKYRFILMNNLSEPTKMPNGTLEYRAVLRNSYFIQGYTIDDDISPYRPVALQKSRTSGKYYIGFKDSLGQTIMPTTLEINVGEGNTWERLQDITVIDNTLLTENIYFNSEETPIATYYSLEYVDSGGITIDKKVVKASANGNNTPSYVDYIPSTKDFYDDTTFQVYNTELIVKSDNWWFLIVSGQVANGSNNQRVRIWENKGNEPVMIFEANNSTTISSGLQFPQIFYEELDGTIYMYYGFQKTDGSFTDNKLYFTMADTNIYEKGLQYTTDTNTDIFADLSTPLLLNSQYYLKKVTLLSPDALFENLNVDTMSVMYGSGVDGEPNETINAINPSKGVLFDENNKMLFARGLYNKKVYNNKTISIVNVPNSVLNGVNINTGALLGYTNYSLVNSILNIAKNIYEDLYINYFNTITMQNRNTSEYIDNIAGASRLNTSSSKDIDYEDAKATKVRINYNDGTNTIGGVGSTINNNICTYSFTIYVPDGKTIEAIEIISQDEKTTYQTITNFGGELMSTKYYQITQDVYVE